MILAIDAGTTGVTALVIDSAAKIKSCGYQEFPQYFPRPGWVSHDANEIWTATLQATEEALSRVRPEELVAIGITNQRETTVIWDRRTGEPIDRAIVWQCRRTANRCEQLKAHEPLIRQRTGLVLDPYFSATKIEWLLENNPPGDFAFGTIDSWLIHKLTAGNVHATDPSNASRTMLFGLKTLDWDDQLLRLFNVRRDLMPDVHPSSGRFGVTDPDAFFGARIPISGVAGDQQAALFGQGCFEAGRSKNTYGTGSFLLLNAGTSPPPTANGLLSTVAWTIDGRTTYAMEGSIFITGAALGWLRDTGVVDDYDEAARLAESVSNTGGVVFVPALTGLGSPHWDPNARGAISGLTRGTSAAHLARAAVEAMAHQTQDVLEVMPVVPTELRVDGGAVRMDLLCQIQADLSTIPVLRAGVRESTALGAGFLAGLAEGVWDSLDDLEDVLTPSRRFEPDLSAADRTAQRDRWTKAVGQVTRDG